MRGLNLADAGVGLSGLDVLPTGQHEGRPRGGGFRTTHRPKPTLARKSELGSFVRTGCHSSSDGALVVPLQIRTFLPLLWQGLQSRRCDEVL